MKRGLIAPPAIQAPAPRQPSFGSAAAKAQALAPGCQNPNKPALWAFAGSKLRILEVPKKRYRSAQEEAEAFREAMEAAQPGNPAKEAAKSGRGKARTEGR